MTTEQTFGHRTRDHSTSATDLSPLLLPFLAQSFQYGILETRKSLRSLEMSGVLANAVSNPSIARRRSASRGLSEKRGGTANASYLPWLIHRTVMASDRSLSLLRRSKLINSSSSPVSNDPRC